jgi:MerR family Zn(II)-responsive transcriptional regulator of zntA
MKVEFEQQEAILNSLRIGELAKATGTSNETLRFYETRGLLAPLRRSEAGYRLFAPDAIARVNFIIRARKMDFSLKEIDELLGLQVDRRKSTCGEVKRLADAKLESIDEKLAELNRMKLALQAITRVCRGGDTPATECSILDALAEQV